MLSSVDFPDPDGPIIDRYSPTPMVKDTWSMARTSCPPTAKVRQISLNSIMIFYCCSSTHTFGTISPAAIFQTNVTIAGTKPL